MISLEEFEKIVAEVVDGLPEEFATKLDNVAVVVEEWPPEGQNLFGLYRGVPLTRRGTYSGVLPDKIAIFAGPILQYYPEPEAAKAQIRSTVLHEIGHHFGMSEEQIRRAERARGV